MVLPYRPFDATYAVSFTLKCPYIKVGISTLTYDIAIRHLKIAPAHHYLEVTQSNVVMNDEDDLSFQVRVISTPSLCISK